MSTANSPAGWDRVPEAPHGSAAKVPQERRDSERVITDWEQETRRLGRALALMNLNVAEMTSERWANRFIIGVGSTVEDCVFLFYGAKFAALMELPEKPDHSTSMVTQLPARYVPVFTKGCVQATLLGAPVRAHGTVDREDGRQELYRAAFIPLKGQPSRQQRLTFGAFNCRVTEQQV
jgi:hypothetical protein